MDFLATLNREFLRVFELKNKLPVVFVWESEGYNPPNVSEGNMHIVWGVGISLYKELLESWSFVEMSLGIEEAQTLNATPSPGNQALLRG